MPRLKLSHGEQEIKVIIDCQAQFKNLKWNCSTFYGENLFGSFVNQGMDPCDSPAADSADFVIT